MAREDRVGQEGEAARSGASQGQGSGISNSSVPVEGSEDEESQLTLPNQSPLYHAEHAGRYERQILIKQYEARYDCRLIVVIDIIFGDSIPLLEELIFDADPGQDLHMILESPGGDGETAVRMVRSCQDRCRELHVIVPNQAKSAGTILALGAHNIVMGPTSDLGPVDPQMSLGPPGEPVLISAKDIIAAVESAQAAISGDPSLYTLHASLLSDVTALKLQQARSALDRTDDLVEEALKSHPGRTKEQVNALKKSLKKPLIDLPKDHSAVVGAADAQAAGLPVTKIDPLCDQWQRAWRLYSKYLLHGNGRSRIYEGAVASRIVPMGE